MQVHRNPHLHEGHEALFLQTPRKVLHFLFPGWLQCLQAPVRHS